MNSSNASCATEWRAAIVYAGQLFASTLPYGCASVHMARHAAEHRCLVQHRHILVRWQGDISLPREMELFDDIATPRMQQCAPDHRGSLIRCRTTNMLRAVTTGMERALAWGADWIFRVRIDLLVETWRLPDQLDPKCLYVHYNWVYGDSPSDNVFWVATTSGLRIFDPVIHGSENKTVAVPEHLVRIRTAAAGLRMCSLPFSVWLAKPEGKDAQRDQRSKGLRRWSGGAVPDPITKQQRSSLAGLPAHLQTRWVFNSSLLAACGVAQSARHATRPPHGPLAGGRRQNASLRHENTTLVFLRRSMMVQNRSARSYSMHTDTRQRNGE